MFDNIFETVNSGFAQLLSEDFVRNPASVPPEWRAFFARGGNGHNPATHRVTRAPLPEMSAPVAHAAPRLASPVTHPDPPPQAVAGSATPIKGAALRLLQNMEASLDLPTATPLRAVDVTLL